MPLRDHVRPPVSKKSTWEGFHGGWPMVIVQHLRHVLPPGFTAESKVHLGTFFETDDSAYESGDGDSTTEWRSKPSDGGVALAPWKAAEPSVAVDWEPTDEYEYAVHIYDAVREQTLVAAIEIVSPANKDRPMQRNNFVANCAALLQAGVSVCVVDFVTVRQLNLYTQLMEYIGIPNADRPDEPRPPRPVDT
jgi:hypothetical protein